MLTIVCSIRRGQEVTVGQREKGGWLVNNNLQRKAKKNNDSGEQALPLLPLFIPLNFINTTLIYCKP